MTEWQHRDVARGHWHGLSLAEQFGKIGSEISRAIRWSTKNPETAVALLQEIGKYMPVYGDLSGPNGHLNV